MRGMWDRLCMLWSGARPKVSSMGREGVSESYPWHGRSGKSVDAWASRAQSCAEHASEDSVGCHWLSQT